VKLGGIIRYLKLEFIAFYKSRKRLGKTSKKQERIFDKNEPRVNIVKTCDKIRLTKATRVNFKE